MFWLSKQYLIAFIGKEVSCFFLVNLSSSAAATIFPSLNKAADAS